MTMIDWTLYQDAIGYQTPTIERSHILAHQYAYRHIILTSPQIHPPIPLSGLSTLTEPVPLPLTLLTTSTSPTAFGVTASDPFSLPPSSAISSLVTVPTHDPLGDTFSLSLDVGYDVCADVACEVDFELHGSAPNALSGNGAAGSSGFGNEPGGRGVDDSGLTGAENRLAPSVTLSTVSSKPFDALLCARSPTSTNDRTKPDGGTGEPEVRRPLLNTGVLGEGFQTRAFRRP